jgi:hypothetical protein
MAAGHPGLRLPRRWALASPILDVGRRHHRCGRPADASRTSSSTCLPKPGADIARGVSGHLRRCMGKVGVDAEGDERRGVWQGGQDHRLPPCWRVGGTHQPEDHSTANRLWARRLSGHFVGPMVPRTPTPHGRQIRYKAHGRWIHQSGRRSGHLDHHPRSGSRLSRGGWCGGPWPGSRPRSCRARRPPGPASLPRRRHGRRSGRARGP